MYIELNYSSLLHSVHALKCNSKLDLTIPMQYLDIIENTEMVQCWQLLSEQPIANMD